MELQTSNKYKLISDRLSDYIAEELKNNKDFQMKIPSHDIDDDIDYYTRYHTFIGQQIVEKLKNLFEKGYLLRINNGKGTHKYPSDVFVNIESFRNNSALTIRGFDINMERQQIDNVNYNIWEPIIYGDFRFDLSFKFFIEDNSECYNISSNIRSDYLSLYRKIDDNIFYKDILNDNLLEFKKRKENLQSELNNIINQESSVKFIIEYMNKNNIDSDLKSNVKSRMIIDSLKETNKNEDDVLTEISEIINI